MSQALYARVYGDEAKYQEEISKYRDLEKNQIVTFDTIVEGAIEIEGMYKPKREKGDLTGFVKGNQEVQIEQHTMNLLVQKSPTDKIESLSYADSFYQNVYPWGEGAVDLKKITVVDNKELLIPGRKLNGVRESPDGVGIMLRSSRYAGDRRQNLQGFSVDEVYDRGLRYENFDLIDSLNNRTLFDREISGIVTEDKIASEKVIKKRLELGLDKPNTLIQPDKCTISYMKGNVARKLYILERLEREKVTKPENIKITKPENIRKRNRGI